MAKIHGNISETQLKSKFGFNIFRMFSKINIKN
jgi:hypothetical protein